MNSSDLLAAALKTEEFLKSVQQFGEGLSLNRLGAQFERGNGLPKDLATAFKCYLMASEMGHAPATFNVGVMYANEMGVSKDLSKAFDFYVKAATLGHAVAMYNLSCMYNNGEYVQQDSALSLKWLKLAAENGDSTSQFLLGLEYLKKPASQQDLPLACMWLSKASDQNHLEAQRKLVQLYYHGNDVPVDYVLAFKEATRLANNNNPVGHYYLGMIYSEGKGVQKNIPVAIEHLLAAAQNNFPVAFTRLGTVYLNLSDNNAFSESAKLSYSYVRKAAELGDLEGMTLLGKWLAEGLGVTKNKKVARYCLEQALTFNHVYSGNDKELLTSSGTKYVLEKIKQAARQELAKLDKGCFISTATALSMGWKDDGPELNALRTFRDGWMQKTQDRRYEVSEYYRIAPEIVKCINATPDSALIYRHLCDAYLCPALGAIQSKNYQEAYKIYSAMVMSLSDQYGNNQYTMTTTCS